MKYLSLALDLCGILMSIVWRERTWYRALCNAHSSIHLGFNQQSTKAFTQKHIQFLFKKVLLNILKAP